MSTVHDVRRSTVLALPNRRERRTHAADTLCPVLVGTRACWTRRARGAIGIDDIRIAAFCTLNAEARVRGAYTRFASRAVRIGSTARQACFAERLLLVCNFTRLRARLAQTTRSAHGTDLAYAAIVLPITATGSRTFSTSYAQ